MKIIKILVEIIILLAFIAVFFHSISMLVFNQKSVSQEVERQDEISLSTNCPYIINENLGLTYGNEVSVAFPPQPLDKQEIILPPQKFDPNATTIDEQTIYLRDGKKQIEIESIDIDDDGSMEQIVSIKVAMNHTPHVALIVKDGNIIFKEKGAQTYIFEARRGEFKVHKTIDWNTGEETITKYKYENNSIIPVWEQKLCNVREKKE